MFDFLIFESLVTIPLPRSLSLTRSSKPNPTPKINSTPQIYPFNTSSHSYQAHTARTTEREERRKGGKEERRKGGKEERRKGGKEERPM